MRIKRQLQSPSCLVLRLVPVVSRPRTPCPSGLPIGNMQDTYQCAVRCKRAMESDQLCAAKEAHHQRSQSVPEKVQPASSSRDQQGFLQNSVVDRMGCVTQSILHREASQGQLVNC